MSIILPGYHIPRWKETNTQNEHWTPSGFTGEGRFPRPPGGMGHAHPQYGNTPSTRQVWSCHYDESIVEGGHWTRERTNWGDSWSHHSTPHHLEAEILYTGPQCCEWHGTGWGVGGVGHNRGWDLPHQENLQNPSHTPARFPSFHLIIIIMTAWDPKSNRCVMAAAQTCGMDNIYIRNVTHRPTTRWLHYTNGHTHTHLSFMAFYLNLMAMAPMDVNSYLLWIYCSP